MFETFKNSAYLWIIFVIACLVCLSSTANAQQPAPSAAVFEKTADPALAPTPPPPAPAAVAPLNMQEADPTGLPAGAYKKLSPDQIYDLAQKKMKMESLSNSYKPESWAAITAPIATFAMIVLIVFLVMLYRSKKDREMHTTLRLMVEKGADIPAELLHPKQKSTSNTDLRRGVLLLFTGMGYMAFMGILGMLEPDALKGLGVGLIPIFIGIGYLLVWRLSKRHENKD
jgi:hypothetical protein